MLVVSSGAVALGRRRLGLSGALSLDRRQAAAAAGQSLLMHAWEHGLAPHGLHAAQILLTRDDMRSRQRFLNARNTFATLLEWGAIPVVNENDTVAVSELKFGDNDNLSGFLLNIVEADLFVNLTSARGVYDADPGANPDAKFMECIEDIQNLDVNALCGAKTSLGSGGMHSKLRSACRAAQIGGGVGCGFGLLGTGRRDRRTRLHRHPGHRGRRGLGRTGHRDAGRKNAS